MSDDNNHEDDLVRTDNSDKKAEANRNNASGDTPRQQDADEELPVLVVMRTIANLIEKLNPHLVNENGFLVERKNRREIVAHPKGDKGGSGDEDQDEENEDDSHL